MRHVIIMHNSMYTREEDQSVSKKYLNKYIRIPKCCLIKKSLFFFRNGQSRISTRIFGILRYLRYFTTIQVRSYILRLVSQRPTNNWPPNSWRPASCRATFLFAMVSQVKISINNIVTPCGNEVLHIFAFSYVLLKKKL